MPQRNTDPHAAYGITFRYRMTGQPDAWRPALEVYETAKALVVRVELAGIDENHLHVALDGDMLTIQGTRTPESRGDADAPEQRSYHEMGIPYGTFRARVTLPFPVMRDTVEANYEHGLLTVVLPRAERVRIRTERPTAVAVGTEDEIVNEDMGKDSE